MHDVNVKILNLRNDLKNMVGLSWFYNLIFWVGRTNQVDPTKKSQPANWLKKITCNGLKFIFYIKIDMESLLSYHIERFRINWILKFEIMKLMIEIRR